MSALSEDIGFLLTTIVAMPRGMTDDEAYEFMIQPPGAGPWVPPELREDTIEDNDDDDIEDELSAEEVDQLLTTTALTAGFDPHRSRDPDVALMAAGFDPEQPRDGDGKWMDSSGVIPGGVRNLTEFDLRVKNARTGDDALRAARGTSELARGEDEVTRWSVAQYYQANSDRINFPLRGLIVVNADGETTPPTLTPQGELVIQTLDSMMRESLLDDDVVVKRGITNPRKIFGDAWLEATSDSTDNSGLEWLDDGYVSTTTSEEIAKYFAGSRGGEFPVIMRMFVPKGTPALRAEHERFAQQELILGRGYRYRIMRDYGRDPSTGVQNIDVEVTHLVPDSITSAGALNNDLVERAGAPEVDFETQPDPPGVDWVDRFIDDGSPVKVTQIPNGDNALAASFDPGEPRDSESKWTDDVALTAADDHWKDELRDPNTGKWVDSPVGKIADAVKKLTPAVIYKKHKHDTVIATSRTGDRRMRWDEQRKKFVVEDRQGDDWFEAETLGKGQAYEQTKQPDKWFEPGQTGIKKQTVAPPQSTPQPPTVDKPAVTPVLKSTSVKTSDKSSPPSYTGPLFEMPEDIPQDKLDEFHDLTVRDLLTSYDDTAPKLTYEEKSRLFDLRGIFTGHDTAWVRAAQEAHLAVSFKLYRKMNDIDPKITDRELKKEMATKTREVFAGKKIAVRVTSGEIDKILNDGRFKSQFESNKSKGLKDIFKRSRVEAAWFGTVDHPLHEPEKRPIYGYVAVDGVRPVGIGSNDIFGVSTDALSQYGTIQVILKYDVRRRTTAMFGDSLNQQAHGLPSPVDNPTWHSFTPVGWKSLAGVGLDTSERDPNAQRFRANAYAEAEVHGGVTLDDVDEIVFPTNPAGALQKKLDATGVKWRVLNLKTAAQGTPEERVNALRIAEQDKDYVDAEIADAEEKLAHYAAKGESYTTKQFDDDLKKLRAQLKKINDALTVLRR